MATVESWLFSRLNSNEGIQGFRSTHGVDIRVFPLYAPQDEPEPYITYRRAATQREYTFSVRSDNKPTGTFDIQCWDTDYQRLKEWEDLVRLSIDGAVELDGTPVIDLVEIQDQYDIERDPEAASEIPVYGTRITALIHFTETIPT